MKATRTSSLPPIFEVPMPITLAQEKPISPRNRYPEIRPNFEWDLMRIAVVGLGKIGLPLAVQFASKGHVVVGVDTDDSVVEKINSGLEPHPGEAGLKEALSGIVREDLLSATTDYSDAIGAADVVVVAVPLLTDKSGLPDFTIIDASARLIGKNLRPGRLVVFETTVPIGTTRNRLLPILEKKSGLTESKDFHLAFSPERVFTGRVFEDLRKYPKLVGGLSPRGGHLASIFYNAVLEFDSRDDLSRPNGVWDLGTAEAAEMAKLAETTYRDVNIALANQFAIHAEELGVDIYPVIEAANSQPFSHIHEPGISVGGHCIPVYPHLYQSTDSSAELVRVARELNRKGPSRAIETIQRQLGPLRGLRVTILGASYRPHVKETAYSGVFDLYEGLLEKGAVPTVSDPLYSPTELTKIGLRPCAELSKTEVLILHTSHPEFLRFDESQFPELKIVLDGRNSGIFESWDCQVLTTGKPSNRFFG